MSLPTFISSTFALDYPLLAKQWHKERNGELNPSDGTVRASQEVWWKCSMGLDHEWRCSIATRMAGKGHCPFCAGRRVSMMSSLAALNWKVAREWHPINNGDLKPAQVRPTSTKQIWWRCYKGHEWLERIDKRTFGQKTCPICRDPQAGAKKRHR